MFGGPNALRDPQIPPDEKTKVQHNVSKRVFCGIHTDPSQA
jgi:hypothetical protein